MIEIDESTETTDAVAISASFENPAAFEALFDRHYGAIWRYACRRAGSGVADEIASETFLRAFRARAKYDLSQPNAGPWLYGIATNLLRNHARAEARRRHAYYRAVQRESIDGGIESVLARVDAATRGRALQSALARLRTADRETLLLYALSDLDYEDIAIATEVPVGTVRSRLHRARRHVAAVLGAEQDVVRENATKSRNP